VTVLDGPHIGLPANVTLTVEAENASVSGDFTVSNLGYGNMDWEISTTSGMLSFSQTNGTNDTIVTVTADTSILDIGDYYGDITVTSMDVDNSPVTIPVEVHIVYGNNTGSRDFESSSSQCAYITDGNQTGLDITGDLTIEAAVKMESVPGNNKSVAIVSKYQQSGDQRSYYLFYYQDASDSTFIGVYTTSNGISDSNGKFWLSPISALSVGAWYHIAVTLDVSATTAKIYVNGQLHNTNTSHAASIYNSSAPFRIGAGGDGPTYFWDGLIDDVRIWNVVRTPTEIADNYNHELVGNEPGLVAYWKLNNDANDSTSNNNDLTNSGSAVYSTDVPTP